MKTPEEMAEEYTKDWWGNLPEAESMRKSARENFLAGYQAGHNQALETKDRMDNAINRMFQKATCFPAPTTQWISVKERLPEKGQIVLTSCEQGKMFLLRKVSEEFLGGTLLWKYCCGYDKDLVDGESYCYEITHWMPLPNPPKDE